MEYICLGRTSLKVSRLCLDRTSLGDSARALKDFVPYNEIAALKARYGPNSPGGNG